MITYQQKRRKHRKATKSTDITSTAVCVLLLVVLCQQSTIPGCHCEVNNEVVLDTTGTLVVDDPILEETQNNLSTSTNSISTSDKEITSADLQCRIWLAPSTLQGAGLGMFAGTDFQPNEELLPGGDITIAITDIAQHNAAPGQGSYGAFLWDEYTWSATGLKMDSEGYECNIASEGFGSAANSFLPVYNVDEWCSRLTYTGLHRSRDPGAGASTHFHQRVSTSRRHISAGEELYVSYGDQWFIGRTYLGPIPLDDDLNIASSVLERYTSLQQRLQAKLTNNNIGSTIAKDIWSTFVQNTVYSDSRTLIGSFHHNDPNELQMLQTTFQNNLTAARIAESKRDVDWLRKHGTCGDHIVAKRSTLQQAGMGAFATRFLPKETIVAQLPMIHVTNRSRFNIYGLSKDKDGRYMPYNSTIIGKQLLLNYCYGHAQSTLLLCPYGPMNSYVNHNQSLANVRLQWGRPESGNHMPALLKSNIQQLETDSTAKLAMELVAIRDIEEGEEIFLDYGDEWEVAWQLHVQTWKPVPNSETYFSAAQLEDDQVTRLRTIFEEIEHPKYPTSLQIKCDTSISSYPDQVKSNFYSGTLDHYLWKTDVEWWPCTILRYHIDEQTGDYLYAVHLYTHRDDQANTLSFVNSNLIENVPRRAIHFVDKPYTSDAHLPNAFRHDIRIPDSIFPPAWRNLKR